MPRAFTLILRTSSPLVITAELAFLDVSVQSVGRAGGSRQPPTAAVIAAFATALLHVGYDLDPLLRLNGWATLARWLMTPGAIIAGLVGPAILAEISPSGSESPANARCPIARSPRGL